MMQLKFYNGDDGQSFLVSNGGEWFFCKVGLMDIWNNHEFQSLLKKWGSIRKRKYEFNTWEEHLKLKSEIQKELEPIYKDIDNLLEKLGQGRYEYKGRVILNEI